MNVSSVLNAGFRAIAAYETGVVVSGDYVEQCCALHKSVVCGIAGGSGCQGWKPGTHGAIKALYSRSADNHYCGTMAGQRVLDQRLAVNALGKSAVVSVEDLYRPGGFIRKMINGFPADVSSYGAGYCYLLPIIPSGRGRAARILGPNPLLVDVLRIWRYLGDVNCVPVKLMAVINDGYHLERAVEVDAGNSSVGFFTQALAIVHATGGRARIGMTAATSSSSGSDPGVAAELIDVSMIRVKEGEGMYSDFGTVQAPVLHQTILDYLGSPRVVELVDWLGKRGVDMGDHGWFDVALASCAAAALPNIIPRVKARHDMWSIVGTNAINNAIGCYCVAMDYSPFEYQTVLSVVSHESLVKLIGSCGILPMLDAGGLLPSSKAMVSILKAVIGVVSLHVDPKDFVLFIKSLGLFDLCVLDHCVEADKYTAIPVIESLGDVVYGLNSHEYAIAMELKKAGKLVA